MGLKLPSNSSAIERLSVRASVSDDTDIDYAALSLIRNTRLETEVGAQRIKTSKLQFYVIEQFLCGRECDALVHIINRSPASLLEIDYGAPDVRAGRTTRLSLLNDALVEHIDAKISMRLGIRPAYAEDIQAQKYDAEEEFKARCLRKSRCRPGQPQLNLLGLPKLATTGRRHVLCQHREGLLSQEGARVGVEQ